MSRRRVVVTGLGIVSPVGNDIAAAWDSILAARSGIAPITRFDASRVPGADRRRGQGLRRHASTCPAKEARRYDTFIHYGIVGGDAGDRAMPASRATPATRSASA